MAKQKRKLGRGLNSLLSSTRLQEIVEEPQVPMNEELETTTQTYFNGETENITDAILDINIDRININPHQPRKLWDQEKLESLSLSIKSNGVIQPILVRKMGDRFQLIAGERRLRASKLAGIKTIPAVVKDATEAEVVEWALVENIHRADLNALERAKAYSHYINEFSLTQQEASQRIGENRSTIANYMRLLDLPTEIQEMVIQNMLSMGHARCLLGVDDKVDQLHLAAKAVRAGWSVRALESEVKRLNAPKEEKEAIKVNAHIVDLALNMTRSIGSKVTIKEGKGKGHKGKVIIEYYSLDDFDKIKERIMHP